MEKGTGHRGIYRLLIAMAVGASVLALGVLIPGASTATITSGGELRALTPAQKKAKTRALAKCRKIKAKARRIACVKRVNRKYSSGSTGTPVGKVWDVELWDDYFLPASLDIEANDAVSWVWKQADREPHNVNPLALPGGVNRWAFTSNTGGEGTRFQRQFTVPGTYEFVCTFHALMSMQVRVTR